MFTWQPRIGTSLPVYSYRLSFSDLHREPARICLAITQARRRCCCCPNLLSSLQRRCVALLLPYPRSVLTSHIFEPTFSISWYSRRWFPATDTPCVTPTPTIKCYSPSCLQCVASLRHMDYIFPIVYLVCLQSKYFLRLSFFRHTSRNNKSLQLA